MGFWYWNFCLSAQAWATKTHNVVQTLALQFTYWMMIVGKYPDFSDIWFLHIQTGDQVLFSHDIYLKLCIICDSTNMEDNFSSSGAHNLMEMTNKQTHQNMVH